MIYKKKLIEVTLPLEAINKAAVHEKQPFTRNIHVHCIYGGLGALGSSTSGNLSPRWWMTLRLIQTFSRLKKHRRKSASDCSEL